MPTNRWFQFLEYFFGISPQLRCSHHLLCPLEDCSTKPLCYIGIVALEFFGRFAVGVYTETIVQTNLLWRLLSVALHSTIPISHRWSMQIVGQFFDCHIEEEAVKLFFSSNFVWLKVQWILLCLWTTRQNAKHIIFDRNVKRTRPIQWFRVPTRCSLLPVHFCFWFWLCTE